MPSRDQVATNLPATLATQAVVVDIVYGLHPDSSTGGCIVQRSFEDNLRAAGVTSIHVHVASTATSAEQVFKRLQEQEAAAEEEEEEAEKQQLRSRVLIIDGIALLFLREKLQALRRNPLGRGAGNCARARRVLVGFIHCPFRCVCACVCCWLWR